MHARVPRRVPTLAGAMLRKYGPLAIVLLLVIAVLYWRFFR